MCRRVLRLHHDRSAATSAQNRRMPRTADATSVVRGMRVWARAPTDDRARLSEARGRRAVPVRNSLERHRDSVREVRRRPWIRIAVPRLEVPRLTYLHCHGPDRLRDTRQVDLD